MPQNKIMAAKMYEMGLVVSLALILCRGATAQSSCSGILNSLSSCISYVTGNSSRPLPSCCSSLASVVESKPQCLCPLLTSGAGASLGIAINRTLALALPSTCNVQTPPVSQCDAVANGPAGAPAPPPLSPPTDATAETPPPSVPSGTGSKTAPNTGGSTSDGNTATTSVDLRVVVTLSVAASIVNKFHF